MNKIKTWWGDWMHCWLQLIISIDQTANCLTGIFFPSREVWADETLSARTGRKIHMQPYKTYGAVIDWIFQWFQGPNHCVNAYKKERTRYNSPPEMRT